MFSQCTSKILEVAIYRAYHHAHFLAHVSFFVDFRLDVLDCFVFFSVYMGIDDFS